MKLKKLFFVATALLLASGSLLGCNSTKPKSSETESQQQESAEESESAPKHQHTLIEHAAIEATCLNPGNSLYFECSECGKYFSDAEGEHEIEAGSWVIEQLEHSYGELVAKVEPTCEESGHEAYYQCSECHHYFTVEKEETTLEALTLAAKGHTLTKHDATEATYTAPGNTEYYSCSECGKYFSDAEGKNEIEENSWVIEQLSNVVTSDIVRDQANVQFTITTDGDLSIKEEDDGSLTVGGWWVFLVPSGMTIPSYTSKINMLVKNPTKDMYKICYTTSQGNWTDVQDVQVKDYDDNYKILSISFMEAGQIFSNTDLTVSEIKILLEGAKLTIASIFFNDDVPVLKVDGKNTAVSSTNAGLVNLNDGSLAVRKCASSEWWNQIDVNGSIGYAFESGVSVVEMELTPQKYFVDDMHFRFTFDNTTTQASFSSAGCTLALNTKSTLRVALPSGATKLMSFGFSGGDVNDQIIIVNAINFVKQSITVKVNGTAKNVVGTGGTSVENNDDGDLVLTEWWTYFAFETPIALTTERTVKIKVTNPNGVSSYLYKINDKDGHCIADAAGTAKAIDADGYLVITLDADASSVGEIGLCNTSVGKNTIQSIVIE